MIEHNGKKYARVSEVLQPFTDFSGIDERVLKNKAQIGTDTHVAIAEDIAGEFPIILPQCKGYYLSFHVWRNAVGMTWLENEKRYYNDELMITGQIDALAMMPGSKLPVLIDFKTSAAESKITWPMQAHLYGWLIGCEGKLIAPHYLFVKLNKRGGLPEVFTYKYDRNILGKCLSAVDDFHKKSQI